jgi:hypothetical protein
MTGRVNGDLSLQAATDVFYFTVKNEVLKNSDGSTA